jgi:serine/threonine protein kinase
MMELVEGGDLKVCLGRLKESMPPIAPPAAEGVPGAQSSISAYGQWQQHVGPSWPLDISMQLVSGLAYLHSISIIHHDLKPANVLLNLTGTNAKITDFGLSKLATGSDADNIFGGSSSRASVRGTRRYASPEALSLSKVGTSADIYALGLIMLELFAGSGVAAGWSSSSPRQMIPADMPLCLKGLLIRCWNANPALRPSAEQVREELQLVVVDNATGNDE